MTVTIFTANDGINGQELWRTDGTAVGTVLLKDIYAGTYTTNGVKYGNSSNPSDFTSAGNNVFFTAADETGTSLWVTNGTTSGTTKLTFNNSSSSGIYGIGSMSVLNDTLYFTAYNSSTGYGLYKSDGTAAGTTLVKGSVGNVSPVLTTVGGKLFFQGYSSTSGYEPWISDGTTNGTVQLKDIVSGTGSSYPANYVAAGSKIYFTASDSAGTELWSTDGTSAGTSRVADIYSGTGNSSPFQLTALGNKLLFSAFNGSGTYLYTTDGTTTTQLTSSTSGGYPNYLTVLGSKALFYGSDGTRSGLFSTDGSTVSFVKTGSTYAAPVVYNGKAYYYGYDTATSTYGLISSDGTTQGTQVVKSFQSGYTSIFTNPVVSGGKLYFETSAYSSDTAASGLELWVTDGTTNGTSQVKDIYAGPDGSDPQRQTAYNGNLLFTANTPASGRELYVSNGTANGTSLVKDINTTQDLTASLSILPSNAVAVGSKLFFSGADSTYGYELYVSDGTLVGTKRITDISPGTASSNINYLTSVNGKVVFTAYDGAAYVLYSSDGSSVTKVGSYPVNYITSLGTKAIFTATDGLYSTDGDSATLIAKSIFIYNNPIVYNGAAYFTSYDSASGGYGLYKSDGSSAGTTRVRGLSSPTFDNETVLNGKIYFTTNDATNGAEPWVSDGTANGTFLLKDIYTGGSSSSASNFTAAGSNVFFTATDATAGTELWITDGTSTNTKRVADINPGTGSSLISGLATVGSKVVFSAYNGTNYALYSSDGTTTTQLSTTSNGGSPSAITSLGSIATFLGYDQTHGTGLFSTDGSTVSFVSNIYPNIYTSGNVTAIFQGKEYFYGYDSSLSQYGIFATDGTAAGTTLVKGFGQNGSNYSPLGLKVAGSKLYFQASDGTNGVELWSSDGTTAGTVMVTDTRTANGSNISGLTILGNAPPEVAGLVTAQSTNDKTAVSPFAAITVTDADAPVQTLAVSVALGGAAKGSLTASAGTYNAATGIYTLTGSAAQVQAALRSLSFTPTANRNTPGQTETTPLSLSVSDGVAAAVTSSVTIATFSVDDAPVTRSEAFTITQRASLSNNVLANDSDVDAGDSLKVSAVTVGTASTAIAATGTTVTGSYGALTIKADGSFTYAATEGKIVAGQTVTDTFTYTAADKYGLSTPGTLAVTVNGTFAGDAGNNILVAPSGSSTLAGGDGDDTAVLNYKLAEAKVGYDSIGHIVLDGPGVHTLLTGFERYQFSDATVVVADGSPLVDDLFYLAAYKTVLAAGVDADDHYANFGWKEGRDPNALFSTTGYLAANRDVRQAGVNPLEHYDQFGWKEGRDPSSAFDNEQYLARNPDVKAAGIDPLTHYLQFGQAEGRQIYAAIGKASDLSAHPGFDAEYYLLSNPDVAGAANAAGGDTFAFAYQHWSEFGWKEGRNPNAVFDTDGYLDAYRDVKAAGVDPLMHYDQFGWKEGRDPSRSFDTTAYLATYGDVAQAKIDPMLHYLQDGATEGRSALGDTTFGYGNQG